MAQVRSSTPSIPHVLVTSKDAVQADGTVSRELVAVSSDALLRQGIEMAMDIRQNDWADTNDYDSAASDTDRDSRLTTTDIDNQLLANTERTNARRNSGSSAKEGMSGEKAPLVTVTRDIDTQLYLEDLEDIIAGVGRPDNYQAPTTSRKLDQLALEQSVKKGKFWIQG